MSVMDYQIDGLVAAPFTPMKDNGDLNLPLIEPYVDYLVLQGVLNTFVCGSTGEGASLSMAERKTLAEKWVSAGKGKLSNVIVHVGGCSLTDSQELARHAESIGAQAIASLPTCVFRPSTGKQVAEQLQIIGAAAPSLPLFYYHLPDMSKVNIMVEDLLDALETVKVPTFRGCKYTDYNMMDFGRCLVHSNGKYIMMYGRDEQGLCALVMGATSFVGSTFNYSGKVYNRMRAAYDKGDLEAARKEQLFSQLFMKIIFDHGPGMDIGLNKYIMTMTSGLDFGPPRPPMQRRSEEELAKIKAKLQACGFFDSVK
ncbi:N-acetylneuraminate lyase-like isoform X2 [Branchiostoma lanceolatum]|uniref:N-acetylneuraminate lyase-like isoform X2 n=1 Tax=Branchiostoma lanceolatum TaxID=7740 RepID=UPI0034518528